MDWATGLSRTVALLGDRDELWLVITLHVDESTPILVLVHDDAKDNDRQVAVGEKAERVVSSAVDVAGNEHEARLSETRVGDGVAVNSVQSAKNCSLPS